MLKCNKSNLWEKHVEKIYCTLTSKSGEEIEIKRAEHAHLKEMLALQERSIDPKTFCAITEAEMEESLGEDLVLAAFASGRIVALNILVRNRPSERSLAPDIGEEFGSVTTFDGVIVAPEYRGLGLQRRFLAIAAEMGREWGSSKLAATVAPSNAPSRANFKREGFCELGEFPKYGSTRIIVVKDLQ